MIFELSHDKTNKMTVLPAKTQISLGICPVWSESSLSALRKLESLATHWAHGKDSDQTGRMPRLIWVFAGHTVIFLVLSWGGSVCLLISKVDGLLLIFILDIFELQAHERCTTAAGFSLGEITALAYSGAISFEDGKKITRNNLLY